MFVGNFRHTPNPAAAKYLARNLFPLVRNEVPEANVVIAGSYMSEISESLAGDGIKVAGWLSEGETGHPVWTSRVVVVPLRTGAGVKLKVVEPCPKGCRSSRVRLCARLPDLDALLPVCDGAEEIAAAIVRILRMSDEEWLNQAASELHYVHQHFSRDAMKQSLGEALELAAVTKPVA